MCLLYLFYKIIFIKPKNYKNKYTDKTDWNKIKEKKLLEKLSKNKYLLFLKIITKCVSVKLALVFF